MADELPTPDSIAAKRPFASVRPCGSCGRPVDPLRAARVAYFGDRFHYFCSRECRSSYSPGTTPEPRHSYSPSPTPTDVVDEPSPSPTSPVTPSPSPTTAEALAEIEPVLDGSDESTPNPPDSEQADAEPVSEPKTEALIAPADIGTLLLAISMVSGGLSVALYLAGENSAALTARVLLVVVACGSFVAHAVSPGRDPADPHPASLLLAPILSATAAIAGRLSGSADTANAVTTAAWTILTVASTVLLMTRSRRALDAERELIASRLDEPGHRVVGDSVATAAANDLRPGEEIVVESGQTIVVDATIIAGSARVRPWLDAPVVVERSEGDPVVAGAEVVEGRLRAIVGWSAGDRAWMRLTNDARRRADVLAPLARTGRHLTERAAPIAAAIAGLAAFSSDRSPIVVAECAAVAHVAFANGAVALICAFHTGRAVFRALRRGIAFRTAEALDRAGRVSTAVFCARGTLLLGEPEVASIEAIGPHEPSAVLSVLAGAETGASHPTAMALLRAARARGIRPDGVRSLNNLPGLGVTGVASSGQPLVAGSRALMLRERISVAAAEARITELEAMGRNVMLVALGGRLIGVVGLQDGLRPGARAGVQHLLDANIEPVLLSGDARETCDALGRAVDIEHIRPEVLPADRGEEIRRLADGGATIAVLGRSPNDDMALSAADVSVALNSAGSSTAEWHVQLASDDIRDAAYALRLAHRLRSEARLGLLLAVVPGAGAALMMTVGLIQPEIVPLAALAGALGAIFRVRSRG